MVSLYRSLAGHGSKTLRNDVQRLFPYLLQVIQYLHKQILCRNPVQIVGHCADRILSAAEGRDLKAEGGENIGILFKKIRLPGSQRDNDRRAYHLGQHFFVPVVFHHPFKQHFLMGRVLVNDIQVVLVLHQPESIEHLADNLVMSPGLLRQKRILKELHLFHFSPGAGSVDSLFPERFSHIAGCSGSFCRTWLRRFRRNRLFPGRLPFFRPIRRGRAFSAHCLCRRKNGRFCARCFRRWHGGCFCAIRFCRRHDGRFCARYFRRWHGGRFCTVRFCRRHDGHFCVRRFRRWHGRRFRAPPSVHLLRVMLRRRNLSCCVKQCGFLPGQTASGCRRARRRVPAFRIDRHPASLTAEGRRPAADLLKPSLLKRLRH